MKKHNINLVIDPSRKVKKVDLMNNLAGICQILHADPSVGSVDIQISEKGKIKHSFSIKLA